MTTDGSKDSFNKDRAELFEALGHPTRIKILQCLANSPRGFSELKKALDIESGGLLQFHLGKMSGLVKVTPEGNYALTDEGKEALRTVVANADVSNNHIARRINRRKTKILAIALTLSIIATVGVVGYAHYVNGFYRFYLELEQIHFYEARITNFTLYPGPSEGEASLVFTWQVTCRNPYDYVLSIVFKDIGIEIVGDIENPVQSRRMSSFLLQEQNGQYIAEASVGPDSEAVISGTLFYNTTLDTATRIVEYLSTERIRINHFRFDAVFSNGAPFITVYRGEAPSVSPDQEVFLIH